MDLFITSSAILYDKISSQPDRVTKWKKNKWDKFWFISSEFKWSRQVTGNSFLQGDGVMFHWRLAC